MDISFSIELYSIVLLLVLIVEYYSKFKNNLSRNSHLFLGCAIVLLLISCINIILCYPSIDPVIQKILKITTFSLAILPPTFLFTYINTNFFNQQKYYKKYNFYMSIFCLLYWVFQIYVIIIYENNLNFLLFNSKNINTAKYMLFISIIPLVISLFRWIYYTLTKKVNFTLPFSLVIVAPIVGVSFDIMFSKAYFVIASYVISILLLYIGKKNFVIYTDPLTGLYNRQILEESIILDRNLKNGIIALLLIDIDKFKHINDTYGHLTGDKALQDVALLLKKSTRNNDYVLRIGGDEFLIIASIEHEDNIKILKDKISKNLQEYNNMNEVKIGLSIGHEIYKGHKNGISLEKYLNNADKKMYEEKLKNHRKKGI